MARPTFNGTRQSITLSSSQRCVPSGNTSVKSGASTTGSMSRHMSLRAPQLPPPTRPPPPPSAPPPPPPVLPSETVSSATQIPIASPQCPPDSSSATNSYPPVQNDPAPPPVPQLPPVPVMSASVISAASSERPADSPTCLTIARYDYAAQHRDELNFRLGVYS